MFKYLFLHKSVDIRLSHRFYKLSSEVKHVKGNMTVLSEKKGEMYYILHVSYRFRNS